MPTLPPAMITLVSPFAPVSGRRWLCLMLLVPITWAGRAWALPCLTILAPSERHDREQGRHHQTLTDWARQALPAAAALAPGAQDHRRRR